MLAELFGQADLDIRRHFRNGWGLIVRQLDSNFEVNEWSFALHLQVFTANVVVSCVGNLNVPRTPAFEGMDEYQGEAFHTAEWKSDFDPTGRTVAVIGTGASAVQIVPSIAEQVPFGREPKTQQQA